MTKTEVLADPNSCFNRAGPATKMFIGLDWDPAVPSMIRHWALERVKRGLNKTDDPQIKEAFALAEEIERDGPAIRKARTEKRAEDLKLNPRLNPAAAWPFPQR